MAQSLSTPVTLAPVTARRIGALAVLVAVVAAGYMANGYTIIMLNLIGIYGVAVLGLVLLTGAAGIISFGHAAFMGIGAYTSAYLSTQLGLSPWVGLLGAIAVTLFAAIVLGVATLHLGGHFLPITTLASGVAITSFLGTSEMLGAHGGMRDIPPLAVFGWRIDTPHMQYALIASVFLICVLGLRRYLASSRGMAVRSLRGGKTMMESLGYNPMALKVESFALSAVLAAVGGWLYAHTQAFISPSLFDMTASMNVLFMGVIGGLQSVIGALLGAAIILYARSWMQDLLGLVPGAGANLEMIFFGIFFILVLRYFPGGLMKTLSRIPVLAKLTGDALPVVSSTPAGAVAQSSQPELTVRVENLTKRFDGLLAVDSVNFTVPAQRIVSLIGPNGAGKTTTFNAISKAVAATSGKVFLNGNDVSSLPARAMQALGLSRTFQHVKLRPAMSVFENVALGTGPTGLSHALGEIFGSRPGLSAAHQRRVMECLTMVGLANEATVAAGGLPLGKQRLVEIARALMSRPGFLMLDEPAAGLRANEKDELISLLLQLKAGGISILIVEHDMQFVSKISDQIVVLNFGKKIFDGSPQDMFQNQEVRNAYLG